MLAEASGTLGRALRVTNSLLDSMGEVVDARELLAECRRALIENDMKTMALKIDELSKIDKQVGIVKPLVESITKIHGGGLIQVIEQERKVHKLDREEEKPQDADFAVALRAMRRHYNRMSPDDPPRARLVERYPQVIEGEAKRVEEG